MASRNSAVEPRSLPKPISQHNQHNWQEPPPKSPSNFEMQTDEWVGPPRTLSDVPTYVYVLRVCKVLLHFRDKKAWSVASRRPAKAITHSCLPDSLKSPARIQTPGTGLAVIYSSGEKLNSTPWGFKRRRCDSFSNQKHQFIEHRLTNSISSRYDIGTLACLVPFSDIPPTGLMGSWKVSFGHILPFVTNAEW